MKVTVYLTAKNGLTIVVTLCVIGLAVIPLKVPAIQLDWLRWQIAVYALAAVAIISIFVQAMIQSREDHERDANESRRDSQIAAMQSLLEKIAVQTPIKITPQIQVSEELVPSDPRIYLVEITDIAKNPVANQTPFVLENRGGSVAHDVQIQTMTFGYQEVTFIALDNVAIGQPVSVQPSRKNASILERESILPVLRDAWNAKGQAENAFELDFPFTVVITYTDFAGKRRIETRVDLTYSYLQESLKRNQTWAATGNHEIFSIVRTSFKLLQ